MNNNMEHRKQGFNEKSIVTIIFAIALLLPILATAELNDGLAAYYPFNGNANDVSGNGNNCAIHEATLTTDRFGNANSAYRFEQCVQI